MIVQYFLMEYWEKEYDQSGYKGKSKRKKSFARIFIAEKIEDEVVKFSAHLRN